jgi:hypothetical protein
MKRDETLTIRMAVPADGPALRRLAELDSARLPEPAPILVAAVNGDLWAALPLNGGAPIADPFRRTTAIVAMLTDRARELHAPKGPTRRRRPLGFARAARAGAGG